MKSWTKRFLLGLMACVVTFSVPLESHAAARLRNGYYWAGNSPTVYFQFQGFDSGQKTAIRSAMTTWNAVRNFSGNPMVTLKETTSASQADGNIILSINDSFMKYYGYTYKYPMDNPGPFSYCKIEINLAKKLSLGAKNGYVDFQSVVVHELGHALGVAHCHESEQNCSFSNCSTFVMNPDVPIGKNRRVLTSYDKSSYQVIYD